jgi:uncharacterized protein YjbJ (UPF0337 family)
MNADSVDRQWQYLRGELKAWWDQLTDADLEQVAGKKAQLVALVQERYGYTRERAQQEVERRLQAYQTSVSQLVGTLTDTAQEVASSLAETAGDVAAAASTAATTVADTVADAQASLQGTRVRELPGTLVGAIRRYPIPAVLMGLGIAVLLGQSLRKDPAA